MKKKTTARKKATASQTAAAAQSKPKRKKVAKKRPAPTSTRANSDPNSPLPDKLLDKQRVILGGRFTWRPSVEELQEFLRREGAVIAAKVNESLDMLIVGGGAKRASEKSGEVERRGRRHPHRRESR